MIWIPILFLIIYLIILSVGLPILIFKNKKLHQTLNEKAAENAALHMMIGDNNPRSIITKKEWEERLKIIEGSENAAEKDRIQHEKDQAWLRDSSLRFPYFRQFLDKESYQKKLEPVLQRYL